MAHWHIKPQSDDEQRYQQTAALLTPKNPLLDLLGHISYYLTKTYPRRDGYITNILKGLILEKSVINKLLITDMDEMTTYYASIQPWVLFQKKQLLSL